MIGTEFDESKIAKVRPIDWDTHPSNILGPCKMRRQVSLMEFFCDTPSIIERLFCDTPRIIERATSTTLGFMGEVSLSFGHGRKFSITAPLGYHVADFDSLVILGRVSDIFDKMRDDNPEGLRADQVDVAMAEFAALLNHEIQRHFAPGAEPRCSYTVDDVRLPEVLIACVVKGEPLIIVETSPGSATVSCRYRHHNQQRPVSTALAWLARTIQQAYEK